MSRRRSRKKKGVSPWGWPLLAVVVGAVFAAGLYIGGRLEMGRSSDAPRHASPATSEAPAEPRLPVRVTWLPEELTNHLPEVVPTIPIEAPQEAPVETTVDSRAGEGTRLALVMDDLGRSVRQVEAIAALGVPVTYAVLPWETRTSEVVAAVREGGGEMICHLPMEPSSGLNPGLGALTRKMSRRQLRKATRKALDQVPGAVGANNHMGSGLTSEEQAMRWVMGVLARRDLFFLDSRTTAESQGFRVAREMGIPAAERQVFLDPDLEPGAIREQFERMLDVARERGAAIAIGHPHPATLEVLADQIPRAQELGFEFVPVSYLLDRPTRHESR